MTFWESFGIAVIPAIISAFVSFWCAIKQRKSEIEKIESDYKKQFESHKNQIVYDIKKEAIFESLTIIDLYLSWLNYDNNLIPCREKTTPLEITIKARRCFNNLCITCENERLITLFGEILFKKHINVLSYYCEYRNEARKELSINEIEFDEDIVFFCKISTKDLEKNNIQKTDI